VSASRTSVDSVANTEAAKASVQTNKDSKPFWFAVFLNVEELEIKFMQKL
jgi:hypothetical protein